MQRPSIWAAALVYAAFTALMLGVGYALSMVNLAWMGTLPGRLSVIAATSLLTIGLPLLIYFARRGDMIFAVRLKLPPARFVVTTVLAAVLGVPTLQYLSVTFLALLKLLGVPVYSVLMSSIPAARDGNELMLIVCVMAILPALLEELMFRGVIMRALEARGRTVALIVSALLFAAVHASLLQFPTLFAVGLAIGFVVMASDSLLLGMVYHFVHNATSLIYDHLVSRMMDMPQTYEGAKLALDKQLSDPGFISQAMLSLIWLGMLYLMTLVRPYRRALGMQTLMPKPAREPLAVGAAVLIAVCAMAYAALGFLNIFQY